MYKSSFRIIYVGILAASGCGLTPDALEGEVHQALSADFVDASNTVTVRIKICPW